MLFCHVGGTTATGTPCIRKAQRGQGTAETGTYGARGAGGAIGRLGKRSFDKKPWEINGNSTTLR